MPRWWALQVRPEALAQRVGQLLQAVVVQRRLTLFQVVDQQVADRPAGKVIAVDHLLGCSLSASAQVTQRRRRLLTQDAHLAQRPVEQRGAVASLAARGRLGVEEFDDVTDGDLGEGAALRRHDQRTAIDHPVDRLLGHFRIGGGLLVQPSEPDGVSADGQHAAQRAAAHRAGQQPRQRRTDQLGADRDPHRDGQVVLVPPAGIAVLGQPRAEHLAPAPAGHVRFVRLPSLLPGRARVALQPIQQQSGGNLTSMLLTGSVSGERPSATAHPGQRIGATQFGGRPRRRRRTRGELGQRRPPGRRRGGCDVDAHHLPVPNSTSRDSGR